MLNLKNLNKCERECELKRGLFMQISHLRVMIFQSGLLFFVVTQVDAKLALYQIYASTHQIFYLKHPTSSDGFSS